jgi:hypothetical protein
MRTVVVAGLVAAGLVLPAVPAATADGPGYQGACGTYATNDTSSGAVLGGPREWNGTVWVQVHTTNPTVTIVSASCLLRQLAGWETFVLTAPGGLNATAATSRVAFTDDVTTPVYLCTYVSLSDGTSSTVCVQLTLSCTGGQCSLSG